MNGSSSKFSLVLTLVVGCLINLSTSPATATAAPIHPAMHHALFELQEARTELKGASHNFGGHREKALEACDAAIKQIELALEAKGDKYKGLKGREAAIYKKYTHHPHIHHAIVELKEAVTELKAAKHDFGGHRAQAIKDIDFAIEQLELALKFAKK